MPRAPLPALLILAALGAAAPAQAGTLNVALTTINEGDESGKSEWRATYVAAPGEANVVTLDRAAGTWTFSDTGSAGEIAAPEPCTRVDARSVTCPEHPDTTSLRLVFNEIDLGDGNDSFDTAEDTFDYVADVDGGTGDDTLTAARSRDRVWLNGGPGNDVLVGSNDATAELAGDVLRGGAGDDTIRGGGGDDDLVGDGYDARGTPLPNGADRLEGGDGTDTLEGDTGPGPAADQLDGGAGSDQVSYAAAVEPVLLSLAGGPPEGAAAGDVIVAVEGIVGGEKDDVLTGDGGANFLVGGSGADVMSGGGGDDTLWADDGADTLLGGDGNDELEGSSGVDRLVGGGGADKLMAGGDGVVDRLRCGTGRDQVHQPDARQPIPATCEGVSLEAGVVFGRVVRVSPRGVRLPVRGSALSASDFQLTISARDTDRRLLARRKVTDIVKGAHALRLRPTVFGRGALGRQTSVNINLDFEQISWRAVVRP